MANEIRKAVYDEQLHIEAYQFKGLMQRFPNHFHQYYVIGFIESGVRHLSCKNMNYTIYPGNLILFNPGDNHTCCQIDQRPLDYRCLNIKKEEMEAVSSEIMGKKFVPIFKDSVVLNFDVDTLREVHKMIMKEQITLQKEELYYFLMETLIRELAENEINKEFTSKSSLELVRQYMNDKFSGQIGLEELCNITHYSKYSLIRNFTITYGVTPFQYLETLRVNHGKQMLEKGSTILDAALGSGFCDQSHFTRFFKKFIGLTPKQYQKIFTYQEVIK